MRLNWCADELRWCPLYLAVVEQHWIPQCGLQTKGGVQFPRLIVLRHQLAKIAGVQVLPL
jgi:hypothetical protein